MVGEDVPTTLTLKNIPDEIYERLKASAAVHRRSLNSEAIACLENVLMPRKVSAEERIERVRALQSRLRTRQFDHDLIDEFKREGRP
jgi:antitoxin FitA